MDIQLKSGYISNKIHSINIKLYEKIVRLYENMKCMKYVVRLYEKIK